MDPQKQDPLYIRIPKQDPEILESSILQSRGRVAFRRPDLDASESLFCGRNSETKRSLHFEQSPAAAAQGLRHSAGVGVDNAWGETCRLFKTRFFPQRAYLLPCRACFGSRSTAHVSLGDCLRGGCVGCSCEPWSKPRYNQSLVAA